MAGPSGRWWAGKLSLVAITVVLAVTLPSGAPAAAPLTTAESCLPPAGEGDVETETLSNLLRVLGPIPDPVRLELDGAAERYLLSFETRLPPRRDPSKARTFRIITELSSSNGTIMRDDTFVVTATAENTRRVLMSICLDPSPSGNSLDAGIYHANVDLIDPRIPETRLSFDVWVGGASEIGYLTFVLVVGALLLLVLPLVLTGLAKVGGGNARSELRRSQSWLLPLLFVVALGYMWATMAFPRTDQFRLWSSSDGVQQFLGFAFGKITTTVTATLAVVGMVPRWRGAIGNFFATSPSDQPHEVTAAEPALAPAPAENATESAAAATATAIATSGATTAADESPPAAPDNSPAAATAPSSSDIGQSDAEGRRLPPRSPRIAVGVLAGGLFVGGLLIGVVLVGGPEAVPDGPAGTRSADDSPDMGFSPPASTSTDSDPTTTSNESEDDDSNDGSSGAEGVSPGTTPDPPPPAPLSLTPGTTSGADAVAGLREEGFVVFDYLVCSDRIDEPGVLAEVRETRTNEVVVGPDGPTSLASVGRPPAVLDVFVTSGEPCTT